MTKNKIIRSVCYFTDTVNPDVGTEAQAIADSLEKAGFVVQTKRICFKRSDEHNWESALNPEEFYLGLGKYSFSESKDIYDIFIQGKNLHFNMDLTSDEIGKEHVDYLFRMIKDDASKTFNFTYGFNIPGSSPYFPSATFERSGFSIGLQPTDLSEGCKNIDEWLEKVNQVWQEIVDLFGKNEEFLGIDSSIAPLFTGSSSLVNIVKSGGTSFSDSVTTDVYTKISRFIKKQNPKPVGLCGLMFPCLEDFELADEYEKGNFSIERNMFLSLHSGLGIDTYPIGIDENLEKIEQILKLTQALSNKYQKPLAARFVSDGKTKIGERSDFNNQYLKDTIIGPLKS